MKKRGNLSRSAAGEPVDNLTTGGPGVFIWRYRWICALLTILLVVAYWPVGSGGFVNLDDDAYVEFQPMVNQGLRAAAVTWAFTAIHSNNWHPITSISHMLDCSLFGVTPGPMHWENVGWHLLNTLLVFYVWQLATEATWRSAIVAGLFGLHPAHVESVAWISERKDVLSTFFWLAAVTVYLRYVREPSRRRYLAVTILFLFGLLAKPMVVTLPFTLLLLDFWPLKRSVTLGWRRLIVEKLPFVALAVAHSAVTLAVQVSSGASNYAARISLLARVENAAVSVVRYLATAVWPHPLAPHYAHPGWWPWWSVTGAVLVIVAISVFGWRQRDSRPWLLFGWGWFLITLLPVIGLIQVGAQSMADRYTYVPFLGLFTIAVWALAELPVRFPKAREGLVAGSVVVIALFATLTHSQVKAWKDSITLYQTSISAGTDNATLRYLLAVGLQASGQPAGASAAQYQRAIELNPDYTNAYTQLALIALNREDVSGAESLILKTISLEPKNPTLRKNLGVLRSLQGRKEEAAAQFREALLIDPHYSDAHQELARLDLEQGRFAEALPEIETVARVSPWSFVARSDLGGLYAKLGRRDEAWRCFARALWINPQYSVAEENLRELRSARSR